MTEPPTVKFPGIDIELSRVLHASEAVTVPGTDPADGNRRRRHPVHRHLGQGQGRGDLVGDDGHRSRRSALWTQKRSIFARGEGGFGGERGPSDRRRAPDRAPDFELSIPVSPQQALLYRMCGDRNPLHSDPGFRCGRRLSAADPARTVHLRHDLQGDGGRAARRRCVAASEAYGARFAGVVFPGETLQASVWKDGDGFRASSPRRSATTPSRWRAWS